jgi:hypothetical protein
VSAHPIHLSCRDVQVRTHVTYNNFTAFGITDGCLVIGSLFFVFGYFSYNHCKKGMRPLSLTTDE